MKQVWSVKTGKYIAVCLLLVLMATLLAGCTNGNTETIDLNAVEHNPNQSVKPFPESEKGNAVADVASGTQVETTDSNAEGQGGIGENTENSKNLEDDENTATGTSDKAEKPGIDVNSNSSDIVAPVEPEYVVVLDPGHGGRFDGAVYGLVEKDTVLKIALYAKTYLEENYPKIEVKMTRETDKDFDAQLAKDLENRVQLGKEMGADAFVSFHLNASVAHNIRGAEVICPHRENVKTDSFLLANAILDELTALGIKRRGIVTKNSNDMVDANGNPLEYYAINRHAANRDMIGIIVEHCFMDNDEDKAFLADEAALQRLGEADARGIAAYFGY